MSFQFIPPNPDGSHGRLHPNSIPPSTPCYIDDWHAQRSLYMGSNTAPKFHRWVSFSSPDATLANRMSPVVSSPQIPPPGGNKYITWPGKYYTRRCHTNTVTQGSIMTLCSFLSLLRHKQVLRVVPTWVLSLRYLLLVYHKSSIYRMVRLLKV